MKIKRNNKLVLAIAAFAFLAVASGGMISVSAATNGQGGFHPFLGKNKTMTAEDKAALEAKMEAARAEREAQQAEIDAAIAAGDYDAWAKAVGDKSPLLKKITADNFSQYVQAENLMKQAKGIYQELGIGGEAGFGPGKVGVFPAGDRGMLRGHGFGRGDNGQADSGQEE